MSYEIEIVPSFNLACMHCPYEAWARNAGLAQQMALNHITGADELISKTPFPAHIVEIMPVTRVGKNV